MSEVKPKFHEDAELRNSLVELEFIQGNMKIIRELGGSVLDNDPITHSHWSHSYDAAQRENVLRHILDVADYLNINEFWAAVSAYDQRDDKKSQQ